MKFPLACADFTFPLLSHDHSLNLISMLGFDGVDIGLFEGRSHLHPSEVLKNPAESGKSLYEKVTNSGLKVADVFLQMDPEFTSYAINHTGQSRRDKARDWFQRTLEYAHYCQSPHVTILPGVLFADESEADSIKRCHEELECRVEQAKLAEITFGIEAHIGSIVSTPSEALKLVTAVPGLTLTLDYTHFTREGLADSEVEPLLNYASHFHVRGACKDRLQCSFNQNVIDYDRVVEVMQNNGYSGYIGIEYVWIDWEHCNEVDNLSETIMFRDYLKSKGN